MHSGVAFGPRLIDMRLARSGWVRSGRSCPWSGSKEIWWSPWLMGDSIMGGLQTHFFVFNFFHTSTYSPPKTYR